MVLPSCPEYLEDRSDDRGEKRGKVERIVGTGVGRSSGGVRGKRFVRSDRKGGRELRS